MQVDIADKNSKRQPHTLNPRGANPSSLLNLQDLKKDAAKVYVKPPQCYITKSKKLFLKHGANNTVFSTEI